jgi:hypothetical protein
MMRLRRPAYAQALQQQREAGQHPWGVQVILGEDWRPAPACAWPRVALKPGDWHPNRIDWSVCAGLPVRVVDRIELEPAGPYSNWLVWAIAAELAEVAAYVDVLCGWTGEVDAVDVLAWSYRLQHPRLTWPGWWSAQRETRAKENRERWHAGVVRWMDSRERRTGT